MKLILDYNKITKEKSVLIDGVIEPLYIYAEGEPIIKYFARGEMLSSGKPDLIYEHEKETLFLLSSYSGYLMMIRIDNFFFPVITNKNNEVNKYICYLIKKYKRNVLYGLPINIKKIIKI